MLVLSRKKNETISLGENIEITVVQVEGNRVKIGINAPDDVTILRGELNDSFVQPPAIPQNRIRNRVRRNGRKYA